MRASVRVATLNNYRGGRRAFAAFIAHTAAGQPGIDRETARREANQLVRSPHQLRALLTNPYVLPNFIMYARTRRLKASTIRVYLNGVRFFTRTPLTAALPLPDAVEYLLKGCEGQDALAAAESKQAASEPPTTTAEDRDEPPVEAARPRGGRKETAPVPVDVVTKVLARLATQVRNASQADGFKFKLLAALCVVGFQGCLRQSEYIAGKNALKWLRLCDVGWKGAPGGLGQLGQLSWVLANPNSTELTLTIRAAKTAKRYKERVVVLEAAPEGSETICPVRLVAAYLKARVALPGCRTTDPAFVKDNSKPPTLSWFNKSLRSRLKYAGLANPERFASHSLRAGAATGASANDATAEEVQALGFWQSNAYRAYVDTHAVEKRARGARRTLMGAMQAAL